MDLFNENQQETDQATCAIPPVNTPAEDVKPARRRRTERFAGLIEETDEAAAAPEAETGGTRVTPAVTETRAQAPVVPPTPSQGVPRPAALGGQQPRRTPAPQSAPTVRRPVDAEGYAPLQQLGVNEQPRTRRPEGDLPRRVRTPETERIAYADMHQQEEPGVSRGLIAAIIALLLLAAIVIGLMMIPEEDPGVLGSIKRTVTAPIKALFGSGDDEAGAQPASASDFTATVSHATAPYKVVFHLITSGDVTAVQVVDEAGAVIPTVTTLSAPNSENTIVWMFEMTLEEDYTGSVQAQMQNNGSWVDTDLWQTLTLSSGTAVAASGAPVSSATPTAAPSDEPSAAPAMVGETDEPELAADEPSAAPAMTDETDEPELAADEPSAAPATAGETEEPDVSPAPATDEPEEQPLEVTATPTLSVTATPTMVPTSTPTEEPTTEPTEAPTPSPTPTATPTPTVAPTPKLEAAAAQSADPSLISTTVIYKDGKKVKEYLREKALNMPASDDYLPKAFGVTTFRGNAFRQNAALGTVENPSSLTLLWTAEASSVAGESRTYYGIGWTGQAVIVRWPADIRKSTNMDDVHKEQKYLTEVIIAGMDGNIYFLDLLDGEATREAIDFGYPMRSTPSVHPLCYPMMTVGQYARKLKSGTSDNIGLYYYDLSNQKQLRLIDGLDRKLDRAYYSVGAFDTSALIDRSTNTLIAIGTNGLLYTEKLDMYMYEENMTYDFQEPTEVVTMMSHTKNQKESYAAVESSLAMYGSYAYYADMDGILRCVDTTTMTTAWAVDTGDAVRAAIALDLEQSEEGSTLWLYTANLVYNSRTKGDVTIRRFNAMTGEEDWAFAIHCAEGKKKDVTFNSIVIPGAMASPVIGQNGLNDLVYFTLSSVSATGAKTLGGSEAMAGVIIAFDKSTGEVVWQKAMDAYCYSSPVAVYDESGKGWIIQACSNGTIYLMDGLTGEVINSLTVNGVIEGSPAVYGDTLVIGTTGKDTSYIYGIKIN